MPKNLVLILFIFSKITLGSNIWEAAKTGDLEAINNFLNLGIDVNAKSPEAKALTPLHEAVQSGKLDAAKFLLERGANVDALDISKCTPLHYLALKEGVKIGKLLLDYGANVNLRNGFNGYTPLHTAALFGYLELAKLFIDRGARVNGLNSDSRNTPLHLAAMAIEGGQKYVNIINLLLDHGGNLYAKDNEGLLPMQLSHSGYIIGLLKTKMEELSPTAKMLAILQDKLNLLN